MRSPPARDAGSPSRPRVPDDISVHSSLPSADSDDDGHSIDGLDPRRLHRMRREASRALQGPIESVPSEQRAVPVRELFRDLGEVFARRAPTPDQLAIAQPVEAYDYFCSHAWAEGRQYKLAAMLYHFALPPALVAMVLASHLAAALWAAGVLPTMLTDVYWPDMTDQPVAVGFYCQLSALVAFVVTLCLWPAAHELAAWFGVVAPINVFMDKLCIDQLDVRRKVKGIDQIGGFLANSERMLVLWSPHFFERLWCCFEVAVFLTPPPMAAPPPKRSGARGVRAAPSSAPATPKELGVAGADERAHGHRLAADAAAEPRGPLGVPAPSSTLPPAGGGGGAGARPAELPPVARLPPITLPAPPAPPREEEEAPTAQLSDSVPASPAGSRATTPRGSSLASPPTLEGPRARARAPKPALAPWVVRRRSGGSESGRLGRAPHAPERQLSLVPTQLASASLIAIPCLFLGMHVVLWADYVDLGGRAAPGLQLLAPALGVTTAGAMVSKFVRTYAHDRSQLDAQLRAFRFDAAFCTVPHDRALLRAVIGHLYSPGGGDEAVGVARFEAAVRTRLRRHVVSSIGAKSTLPLAATLAVCCAAHCFYLDLVASRAALPAQLFPSAAAKALDVLAVCCYTLAQSVGAIPFAGAGMVALSQAIPRQETRRAELAAHALNVAFALLVVVGNYVLSAAAFYLLPPAASIPLNLGLAVSLFVGATRRLDERGGLALRLLAAAVRRVACCATLDLRYESATELGREHSYTVTEGGDEPAAATSPWSTDDGRGSPGGGDRPALDGGERADSGTPPAYAANGGFGR